MKTVNQDLLDLSRINQSRESSQISAKKIHKSKDRIVCRIINKMLEDICAALGEGKKLNRRKLRCGCSIVRSPRCSNKRRAKSFRRENHE